jgi:hypothetical protein
MELNNTICFSKNLLEIRNRINPAQRNNGIVLNPYYLFKYNDPLLYNTTSTDIKFYRNCHDVDDPITHPPEPIRNWDSVVFCDFKLYDVSLHPATMSWVNAILNKFTNNFQPTKILHISLDQSGTDVLKLLNTIPIQSLQINNKLVIEIYDRTETIKTSQEARTKIANLFNRPEILLTYYWNTSYHSDTGYGLEISDSNSSIDFFKNIQIP